MFCHGTPGSRRYPHPDVTIASSFGIRLIAADRPGYGLSTFQLRRRLLDWPDDLAQLADALGIERFAVVGPSGGGPHPLACALKLVGRLTSVGLLASTAPRDLPSATEGMAQHYRRSLAITRNTPFYALRASTLGQCARSCATRKHGCSLKTSSAPRLTVRCMPVRHGASWSLTTCGGIVE